MLKKKIVTVFLLVVTIFSLTLSASAVYMGDVNGDGNITASDARTILRVSAKLEQLDDDVTVYADMNSDNKITASDARTVLRMAAQLENLVEITTQAPVRNEILDYITYIVENGKVTITDCDDGIAGAFKIPSTIEGYPVTSIGEDVFMGCESLTGITIPDSVTTIGDRAFFACTSLTSIEIPDSVTSFGWGVFRQCTSLTSIKISDSLTSISEGAFSSCALTSVEIPDSVTSIEAEAFWLCDSLSSVTIPDSVTSIGWYAFYNCPSLLSVTIPASVTFIDEESLGYIYDSDLRETVLLDGFVIHGISGSAAETYAKNNGITFVADDKPSTEQPDTLTSIEVHDIASKYTVEVNAFDDEYISTGSGFFISTDGKVVTNYHVIDGKYEITVTDYNGTEYEVTDVLAFDEDMDIAVLKVTANATPAVLNYSTPLTGAVVYTLGSSKGMTDTFSNGIISNGSRVVEEYNPNMTYIQTSAPVSNGNSGGPLINDKAEVIGINTWGITDGQNLNFAIPVKYINELDYSNPLTMEEFGALFIPVTPTPTYPSSSLRLSADTSVRYLDKGGTAMVAIEIIGDLGSKDIIVNYDSSTFRCEWEDNRYSSTTTGNDVAVVYVSALRFTSTQYIRVYVEGYKDSIYVDIPINVSSSGWYDYGGCVGAPDYGTYTGVAPNIYYMNEDATSYGFFYSLYDLANAGLSADDILTNYFYYLEYYGYTYVSKDEYATRTSYTFYNAQYDIMYSYSLVYDNYGDITDVMIVFTY